MWVTNIRYNVGPWVHCSLYRKLSSTGDWPDEKLAKLCRNLFQSQHLKDCSEAVKIHPHAGKHFLTWSQRWQNLDENWITTMCLLLAVFIYAELAILLWNIRLLSIVTFERLFWSSKDPTPMQGNIFSLDLHWSQRWQNLDENWLKDCNP